MFKPDAKVRLTFAAGANTMEDITIKSVSVNDYKTIQSIGRETFFETFAASNSKEAMQKYLDESFSDEKVKREIANPDALFFIAWAEQIPIGYLKVNVGDAQTELQDLSSLEIERIYVKSSHHGKKIGQILYEKAIEIAKQKNMAAVWLGVWEENYRAMRFYQKNGFNAFDKHIFKMGDDEQTDIMMRKVLD